MNNSEKLKIYLYEHLAGALKDITETFNKIIVQAQSSFNDFDLVANENYKDLSGLEVCSKQLGHYIYQIGLLYHYCYDNNLSDEEIDCQRKTLTPFVKKYYDAYVASLKKASTKSSPVTIDEFTSNLSIKAMQILYKNEINPFLKEAKKDATMKKIVNSMQLIFKNYTDNYWQGHIEHSFMPFKRDKLKHRKHQNLQISFENFEDNEFQKVYSTAIISHIKDCYRRKIIFTERNLPVISVEINGLLNNFISFKKALIKSAKEDNTTPPAQTRLDGEIICFLFIYYKLC